MKAYGFIWPQNQIEIQRMIARENPITVDNILCYPIFKRVVMIRFNIRESCLAASAKLIGATSFSWFMIFVKFVPDEMVR